MRQFCGVLCGAFLLDLVASSSPKALLEAKPTKEPLASKPKPNSSGALSEMRPAKEPITPKQEEHKHHKVLRQAATRPARLPMLELMSLSLDNWGALHDRAENLPDSITVGGKAIFEPWHLEAANDVIEHFNPLAQMPAAANIFDTRSLQAHPLNFAQFSEPQSDLAKNLMLVIFALVALLVVAYLMSCLCFEGSDMDDEQVAATPKEGKIDGGGLKTGQYTWPAAYAEATGEQKEAFELLFRCNMVSHEEFSHEAVSREHIEECTWIATHMLERKPLEEWVGLWQQAQRSFEDSVADCFEAHGGQVGLGARALAQRLTLSRSGQFRTTPSSPTSRPSSANLDFVSDANLDLRPLHS